jgi:hypothetical protein
MEMDKLDTLPPPPGVVGSLRAGFDAIASHLPVVLVPLALDLFLWLGPRLRMDRLFKPIFDEMFRYAVYGGFPAAELQTFQENSSLILESLQQYNVLSALRTFPIGIFSLMSGARPSQTPLGAPSTFQVDSLLGLMGWILLVTLLGWMGGGLFFRWVSMVVTDPKNISDFRVGPSILQTVLISITYFMLAIILGTPVLIMLALVMAASPLLAQGLILILGLLSMWLVVPVFFSPHGIFLRRQNAFSSIYASLRMARFTMPTSSLFVLSVLLLAYGLNFLWNIPSSNSWMVLVGILGHAFVTTSLLAASFIYYRDMQVWLQTVFEKLKANLPTQQV